MEAGGKDGSEEGKESCVLRRDTMAKEEGEEKEKGAVRWCGKGMRLREEEKVE